MTSGPINAEDFAKNLQKALTDEMARAAEPIVQRVMQQAMAEVEHTIRKRLAEMVVSIVHTGYSVERDGHILVIRVQPLPNRGPRDA